MRILLTTPFAFPYVRRGVERYVGELSSWLARHGHDVTVLTTAPDESQVHKPASGASVRYVRSGPPIGFRRWRTDELWRTLPALTRGVLALRDYDLVEAHHFPDALVLDGSARLGRTPPYALWLPGVARRSYFEGRPLYRVAATHAMRGARLLIAFSRFAADPVTSEFFLPCEVLHLGVDTSFYSGERPPTPEPWILCAAAAEDRRKRVDVLVQAFAHVARRHRTARLVLAQPRPQAAEAMIRRLDAEVRDRITICSPTSEELAALYRSAAVSVLPSVDEAFGLVLVESLAAGTPVVGTTYGAAPEIVDDEAIGRLTPPDDAPKMASAILEALELASDPGTAAACRTAARRWDWDVIGPLWLELRSVLA